LFIWASCLTLCITKSYAIESFLGSWEFLSRYIKLLHLCNPVLSTRFHNSPSVFPTLNYINTAHTFPSYFHKRHFNIILLTTTTTSSVRIPSRFLTKYCRHFCHTLNVPLVRPISSYLLLTLTYLMRKFIYIYIYLDRNLWRNCEYKPLVYIKQFWKVGLIYVWM